MNILLVEDNELNRDMLVRRLERAGHLVSSVKNGKDALSEMVNKNPDLVLMDMNLPVMDGWTACREAKKDSRISDIPIIALTAHAMDSDKKNAMEAGCQDYATKPIDFPALLKKMDAAVLKS